MLAIQHWKDYPVHYGAENSILSMSLMKKVTWQEEHENYGTPITKSTLEQISYNVQVAFHYQDESNISHSIR